MEVYCACKTGNKNLLAEINRKRQGWIKKYRFSPYPTEAEIKTLDKKLSEYIKRVK